MTLNTDYTRGFWKIRVVCLFIGLTLILLQLNAGFAQNVTVGNGENDHTAYVFSPCRWETDRQEEWYRFHVCDTLEGQKYEYVSYIDASAPGPPDYGPNCTVTSFQNLAMEAYDMGTLLISGHGSPEAFLVEAYPWDPDGNGEAARDAALLYYLATGYDSTHVVPADRVSVFHGIAVTHEFLSVHGWYPGALVYVQTCYGDNHAEAFTNLGSGSAEVALGTPCFPDPADPTGVMIYYRIHKFFKNMNGWASRDYRSAINAKNWLGDTLMLYGNGNVTLAPAVDSLKAPDCLRDGDEILIYLDTECDIFVDPIVTFTGCDSCEISSSFWWGTDIVKAICGTPPENDAYGINLSWATVKSANNNSYLDGNTNPSGYESGGLGPAHDDYLRPRINLCTVAPPKIKMGQKWNANPYHQVELSLTMEGSTLEMGHLLLNFYYDPIYMTLTEVKSGQFLVDCVWEDVSWMDGNGHVSVWFQNNAGPLCWGPDDTTPVELAILIFEPKPEILAKSNREVDNHEHQSPIESPIRFYWFENEDNYNIIGSPTWDTLYYDNLIYDYDGSVLWDEENDYWYPDWARDEFCGTKDNVLDNPWPGETYIRFIEFYNGVIEWSDATVELGDINLNGIANEIADAVVFSNYFIFGPGVLDPVYYEDQVQASDVNDDGIPLTIADLVFLIRIITGDAIPYAKETIPAPISSIDWQYVDHAVEVSWNSASDAGAVFLIIEHQGAQFGEPELGEMADGIEIKTHNNGTELRVLICGMRQGARVLSGNGSLLRIPVISASAPVILSQAEAADYFGSELDLMVKRVVYIPDELTLLQNTPNPFNSRTSIEFDLPEEGSVTLTVYDVLGRPVNTLIDEYLPAGVHRTTWDGRDDAGGLVTSGVYFYRIATPTGQANRKMVLLK